MTRLLRDRDVRALVSFPGAVAAVARGVISADQAAAERSIARFDSGWLRVMSGTLPNEDLLGLKAFHLIPGAGVRYLIALYRLSDGEPLALIDANYITSARTSAAAAAAAARFFNDESISLGIVGSGTLARDGLRALASVCSLRTARVFSPTPSNRQSYASELGPELGIDLQEADSPAAAAAEADMVLCATQTHGVVALSATDLSHQRYVSSVSSTLPVQRELDEHVIASAGLVVIDTPHALSESGDLIAARAVGLDERRVVGLAEYLTASGPEFEEPVVYKSIGSVEQDLALAGAVWRGAEQQGIGEEIDAIEQPRL